jgi:cysteine desulfurase
VPHTTANAVIEPAAEVAAGAPVYLDHNATTPLDPAVLRAMLPFFTEHFGNPASVEHAHGNVAQSAVERAREETARAIGARAAEVIFTGGCTEANNLAILGVARLQSGPRHFITTQIEHPSVLEVFHALEREGHSVTFLGVGEDGRVDPDSVEAAFTEETLLVSVMAANNEVGTLQPIREIGQRCEARGVLFHSDLAQALAYVDVDVIRDHVHLASVSGHKAYGPKGVGALYVRSRGPRVRLAQILFGGGQERGLRSGTVNVPLVVGLGAALAIAQRRHGADSARLRDASQRLYARIERLGGVWLNGHPQERLPNNLSLSVEGVEPLALIRLLRADASFSASSACATHEVRTSHVLLAMFGDTWRARQAFRLAPGRFTTETELEGAGAALVAGIERLRGGG